MGPPFITSRLADREAAVGGVVFFRAEANGARPLSYQWRRDGVGLPAGTNGVLELTGVSPSDEGNYSVVVSNALGTATIPSAKLWVIFGDVQAALNNNLPWNSDFPPLGWFAETNETHDGVSAAQSGAIGDSESSWLDSSVVGPGTLSFWWKVSSEEDYDFLEFYLDGAIQAEISGEVPWEQQTFSIPAGAHTLSWVYAKDISDSFGQDAGWLDQVTFTPAVNPPLFGGGATVSNGTFAVPLTGPLGATVIVQGSSDLLTWTPIQTNTISAGGLNLSVQVGTNRQMFFRAVIPPP
jgi:hypothetical protein